MDQFSNGGIIVSKQFTTMDHSWGLGVNGPDNHFAFAFIDKDDNTFPLSTTSVFAELDTWYHVAATYDRLTGFEAIYVNGTEAISASIGSVEIMVSETPTRIGCNNLAADGSASRNFFPGVLDEVMVFNRALDAKTIKAYYDAAP